MEKREKQVREWVKNLPYLFASCGMANECEMAKELVELLKEQEAVKPVRDEQTGRLWLCGNCGSYVGFEDNDQYDPNEFDKYCRECGRPVLWDRR